MAPCLRCTLPPSRCAVTVPPLTGMVSLTGKWPCPISPTMAKAPHAVSARQAGTPSASATRRARVIGSALGRAGPVPFGKVSLAAVGCIPSPRPQVAQDRQHAAVVPLARREAELGEDVVDVLFDRAAADHEALGD